MSLTIIAAIVLLGVVIFVHELGHFLAAKAVGIGVPRFSIGFGSATPIKFIIGETEYVVAWIPLGGYVKMATEEEESAGVSAIEGGGSSGFPPDRLFENKPLWARMFVLSAGVLMNAVLAWGLYAGIALTVGGAEDPTTRVATVTDSLLPPEAAQLGSLPFGTRITRINDDTVNSWNAIRDGILDVTSDRLRFDFDVVDPVILPIPGTQATARASIYSALAPLHPALIASVTPGRPAARAGMQPGDLVIRADGDTIRFWGDMLVAIEPSAGRTMILTVLRDGAEVNFEIVPDEVDESVRGPLAEGNRRVGFIGVGPQLEVRRVEFGPIEAVVEGGRMTWGNLSLVVFTVKGLLLGRVSPKELGGPIVIGQLSGQAARLGPIAFLTFMAFISINLAIFNLLPIPVLDGGHLLFLALEGIRGKPVSLNVRLRFTQVGLAMLLALVVFVVFNDVARIVGG